MNIVIPRKEVYRYLGYGKQEPDPAIQDAVETCIQQLKACLPKSIWKEFDLKIEKDRLCFEEIQIQSKDLAKNLNGCTKVICLATTLGIVPDRLIARANITNKAHSVILQAAACAMIEEYTDQINALIIQDAKERGYFCRPRFSCGYGDFKLEHQKDFNRLLNMPKTIGVTLTDGYLMVPYKSVTAVIGLSHQECKKVVSGCSSCEKKDCQYKK